MRYICDNDLHIHSHLSLCSGDSEQTAERILQYALDNNLRDICLTDHFWDETIDGAPEWWAKQNFERISKNLPLPKSEGVRFMFGCETDFNMDLKFGISKERLNSFDFIIVSTTHLHLDGFSVENQEMDTKRRAEMWVERFDKLLGLDLPFHKIGVGHLTCPLIDVREGKNYTDVLNAINDDELCRLFTKASKLGVGIELNMRDSQFSEDEYKPCFRIFRTAKDCGCKFYFGSDAHRPSAFNNSKAKFEKIADILGLCEDDKFVVR